ncbi:hypothetical protein [Cutibacterium sp. V970]|uniref:hypothetical protein n=1 Tax=Cutibacterium sp. V970 TaxID=3446481 RepID=UPI003EE2DD5F
MSEIDKTTVWAVCLNMRLFCLLEYLRDLDQTPARSRADEQIRQYLHELLDADPAIVFDSQ